MRSGDPDSSDELRLVIQAKRATPGRTIDIVSDATQWLKAALKGAEIGFSYASCDQDYYGYAAFSIIRSFRGEPVNLDLKIAEIRGTPYCFAEVRSLGKFGGTLFPFFGDIRSDDGRDLLLHYIADFLMSSEP